MEIDIKLYLTTIFNFLRIIWVRLASQNRRDKMNDKQLLKELQYCSCAHNLYMQGKRTLIHHTKTTLSLTCFRGQRRTNGALFFSSDCCILLNNFFLIFRSIWAEMTKWRKIIFRSIWAGILPELIDILDFSLVGSGTSKSIINLKITDILNKIQKKIWASWSQKIKWSSDRD